MALLKNKKDRTVEMCITSHSAMGNAIHSPWKSKKNFPTACKQRFPQLHKMAGYTHSHCAGRRLNPSLSFLSVKTNRRLNLIVRIQMQCYNDKKRKNGLMKELVSKLWDIFKKDPLGIVSVLAMDIAGIIFLSLNPFVIGSCIDGFFEHNYFWFYILIVLQFLFIAVRAANKILDTRVYERIIEAESNNFYEEKIQTNLTESQISSRLNLVEGIISFFEFDLVQIIDMFGGIVFSLAYIFTASGMLLFSLAIIVSILVYFFTKSYHRKIADNNINFQNHDETREEVISSRNRQQFRVFSKVILNLRISNSDLDAKAYLCTDILQSIFLIFAMIITVHMGNYTSGQLFSIISYIIMLNESVCEINEVRVKVYDLIDSVDRLERNEE